MSEFGLFGYDKGGFNASDENTGATVMAVVFTSGFLALSTYHAMRLGAAKEMDTEQPYSAAIIAKQLEIRALENSPIETTHRRERKAI